MLWKIAIKNIKSQKIAYCLVFSLLTMITVTTLLLLSAMTVKYKKYTAVSKYLGQEGLYLKSYYFQTMHNGEPTLFRDEADIRERYPFIKDLLSISEIQSPCVESLKNEDISVWSYSKDVINMMKPSMYEGRWFTNEDYQSDNVRAVITYTDENVRVGDVLALGDKISHKQVNVEVIGILNNDESLFYNNSDHKDYRDFFYTYDFKKEKRLIMILAEEQIINNTDNIKFAPLNFRSGEMMGYQKQVQGEMIITFSDNASSEDIADLEKQIKQNSGIYRMYSLKSMDKNSKYYIYKDLKKYALIIICFFCFTLIAVSSAHIVNTKRNLKDYAIYYICGLSWKRCSVISFYVSGLISALSVLSIIFIYAVLYLVNLIEITSIENFIYYIIVILGVNILFIVLSWFLPYIITKKETAISVMKSVDNL